MADNYPYKIVRTGDQVETVYGQFHTIQFIVRKGARIFESTMEEVDSVVVEIDGLSKYIQRELIRKVHTVENKKCPKTKKNKLLTPTS